MAEHTSMIDGQLRLDIAAVEAMASVEEAATMRQNYDCAQFKLVVGYFEATVKITMPRVSFAGETMREAYLDCAQT